MSDKFDQKELTEQLEAAGWTEYWDLVGLAQVLDRGDGAFAIRQARSVHYWGRDGRRVLVLCSDDGRATIFIPVEIAPSLQNAILGFTLLPVSPPVETPA